MHVVGSVLKEREVVSGLDGEDKWLGSLRRSSYEICVEIRYGTDVHLILALKDGRFPSVKLACPPAEKELTLSFLDNQRPCSRSSI